MAKFNYPTWLRDFVAVLVCLLASDLYAAPSDLDPSFTPGAGPSAKVRHVFALPDDKAFIAGDFISYDGASRRFLARLQASGALDETFDAGYGPEQGSVQCVAPLPNGKVLVGGLFSRFATVEQPLLVRLNLDGSVDQTFDAQLQPVLPSDGGLGLVKTQLDGKILVSGVFRFEGETAYRKFARLHPNGGPDLSFEPDFTILWMDDFIVLPDGRIVISGAFQNNAGVNLNRVLRLLPDGTLDANFQSTVTVDPTYLAIQADGRVLAIGKGQFNRLNSDGSSDPSFNTDTVTANSTPRVLVTQPNGEILMGGLVYEPWHTGATGVTRLSRDGSNATNFALQNSGMTGVESIALDSNGRVLVAGSFLTVNGVDRPYLARLVGGESQSLEGPGRFGFSFDSYVVNEATGSAQIVVTRPVWNQSVESIHYELTPETADAADFTVSSGTLTFAVGESFKVIPVPLTNDSTVEADETFKVKLSDPSGSATIWSSDTATVTITDNDKPGLLEWKRIVYEVSEDAGSATFVVTRNGETSGVISVDYTGVTGTAQSGTDYTPISDTLTFADGENTKSITVSILDDAANEGIEAFTLQLSNPTGGATLATGATATVRIVDDEMPGTIAPGFSVDPVALTASFRAAVELANGQLLVAGGGHVLRRLNPDGSNDSTFAPLFPEGASVDQIVVQSDGRIILLGSNLRNVADQRQEIVRLNPGGAEDSTFNLGPQDGVITRIALQRNDYLLVSGSFKVIAGGSRNFMARLTPQGLLDEQFTVVNALSSVDSIVVQPDGKILVGGSFSSFAGTQTPGLTRLHPGGEREAEFVVDPSLMSTNGFRVRSLALQPDGKIVAAGRFVSSGGVLRTLIRFLPNGKIDPSFNAGTLTIGSTLTGTFVLLQPDGRIVADGFPQYTEDGVLFSGVERRLPNGSLDPTFLAMGYRPGNLALLLEDGEFLFSTIESDDTRDLIKVRGGDPVVAADGEFAFAWPSYEINESASDVVVHVLRKNGNSGAADVSYVTEDGTAVAGRDYTSKSGLLTFAAGEVSKAIKVPIMNTPAIDGTRHFSVRLIASVGNVPPVGAPATATVAIRDDERPGRLEFEAKAFTIREGNSITVRVKRTLGSEGQASVNVVNTALTAGGLDYTVSSDMLVFEEGEIEKTITIQSSTDNTFEGAEWFFLQLSGETGGASLGPISRATITILDSDDGGSLAAYAVLGSAVDMQVVAKQADGKVIIAGSFDALPGRNLVRLHPNGTLDATFEPSVVGSINSIATQPDGRIVLAGAFLRFGNEDSSTTRAALRLHANGSKDETFSTVATTDGTVNVVGVQPDGRIILAGDFTTVNGNPAAYLARLLIDGGFDETFQPSIAHALYRMVIASDGGILFVSSNRVVRLHPEGATDSTYITNFSFGLSPGRILLDRHDRLLVSGFFTMANGVPRRNLARLLPTGQLDLSFDAGDVVSTQPIAIALQDDERILIGSPVLNARGGVIRLFDDGVLDPSFAPLPVATADWGSVANIAVLSDAGVLVDGAFKVIDGTPRNGFAMLLFGHSPGAFQFPGKTVEATEAESNFNLTITRAGGSTGRAEINYRTEPGTALAGTDFVATSGTLVFEDGEQSKLITIPITTNSVHEETKYFIVRVSEGEGSYLWKADTTVRVNLNDDDPPLYGSLQFAASSVSVNEEDGVVAVTIERVNGSERVVNVVVSTAAGTAKAGADFVAHSETVTFAEGQTSHIVEIPILGGDLAEPAEEFTVVLSQPGLGASLGTPTTITVTILDGDTGTLDSYRGTYTGLFHTNGSLMNGRITMKVGLNGSVSGVINFGKNRYSFRGKFDSDGTLTIAIARRGLESLQLTLQLDVLSPASEQVAGIVSLSGVDYDILADRQVFTRTDKPLSMGRYAVALEPGANPELPPGSGYASMTVGKGGVVRIAGKLADGAAFAASSFVTKNNEVPLYAPLYAKIGGLFGVLQLTAGDRWTCSGESAWVKPARSKDRYYPGGFAGTINVSGAAALPKEFGIRIGLNVDGALSGGNLTTPIGLVALERLLAGVLRGPESLKLKVNPSSGLITGQFKHPQSRRLTTVRGVYLRHEERGTGFFLGSDSGGALHLETAPALLP